MNTFVPSLFCSTGTPGERRQQGELKDVREKKGKRLEESDLHSCALLNPFFIICPAVPLHALPGSAGFGTFWANVSSKDTIRGIKASLKPTWGVTALLRAMGFVDETWKDQRARDRAEPGRQTASHGRGSSFQRFYNAAPEQRQLYSRYKFKYAILLLCHATKLETCKRELK